MKKGFTLIELLIVMAIISILVAIAIPQIQEYRSRRNGNTTPVAIDVTPVNTNNIQIHEDIKCIGGFKFYNDKQIIGTNGGGVVCR